MYSVVKHVQILISLLKEYNIKRLVLSPGSRNVPFVHSVEHDPYFTCYSVVDERSAAYFALGIAEETGEPVLVSCTSATATSNYLPAVREAYNRKVSLVILTADRDPYYREQMENQMIVQPYMYGNYCKKSVDLPSVNNIYNAEYCERLVNEALLELDHHEKGPVHINFPSFTNFTDFSVTELPKCRVIKRIDKNSAHLQWEEKINELKKYNKIMLLFGESSGYTEEMSSNVAMFFKHHNCIISVEHMANLHCEGCLHTFLITEGKNKEEMKELMPDLLISFGSNYASELKNRLRENRECFHHWRVSPEGNVVDTYMKLDTIFECESEFFFEKVLNEEKNASETPHTYYDMWKKRIETVVFPELQFTNFYAIGELAKYIPPRSILHLSVLNSIRLMQFFKLDETVQVFANLGAFGIDGALSTFMGQINKGDDLGFLVVGDLSFFYDMNSLLNSYSSKNMRILLVNNHGGGEFYTSYKHAKFENIGAHIAANHCANGYSWISNFDVTYLSAKNEMELEESLQRFISKKEERPIILEVFTNIEQDAKVLNEFYDRNHFM